MEKRRGRPKKEDGKDYQIHIRLSKDELDDIEYLAYRRSISKTDALKEGLRLLKNIDEYSD